MQATEQVKKYKKVESILISQPKPEAGRSPYYDLEKKYGLKIDFRPFIHVEGVDAKEFRKQKVNIADFMAVIFTSKNAIDHFFRLCEETRVRVSPEARYFCISKAIADYLQKFIVYRKRKVFVGERSVADLKPALFKYKNTEKFLLPCSNLAAKDVSDFLTLHEFKWQEALMYNTLSSDLTDLEDVTYDVLAFFSPQGIQSLFENFPKFKQNETRIAVFGKSTRQAAIESGLVVNIEAPLPEVPSMTMALENYLLLSNPLPTAK